MTIPGLDSSRHRHWLETIDRQLEQARTRGSRMALVVINLRRFRQINIGFGHAAGDSVLELVWRRIREALRPDDLLHHIGNDEFAVLLTDLRSLQVTALAVEKILARIAENMQVEGNALVVAAVAGAAVYPDHADTRETLLQAAESALHFAVDEQLGYSIYDASTRDEDLRIAGLKGSLRTALDNGELLLHYQPQLDLQHGTLSGGEALARWHHAQAGWIRPDVFVTLAERIGLIDDLTYWSLNVALREWRRAAADASVTPVSVNLSARLLHSAELVPMVEQTLNIWGASPGSLVLEVTESAMMADPGAALRTLSALHEMGITLSIDDFGTGYSSLAYLKKLPVSELKIDKSFVTQMADDRQDRKIVQSVIDLAHTLDMRVVAEGIEDERILDMLVGMGCDFGQGYHIARPMPAVALADWLRSSPWCTDTAAAAQAEHT